MPSGPLVTLASIVTTYLTCLNTFLPQISFVETLIIITPYVLLCSVREWFNLSCIILPLILCSLKNHVVKHFKK